MAAGQLPNASFIERGSLRFLLIDCPTDANLDSYISEFKKHGVTDLVRATDGSPYKKERVESAGIAAHDLAFADGDSPPPEIVTKWLEIIGNVFGKSNASKKTVAVHCIAGLGRTAVLVAVALIEDGVQPLDAVQLIRGKRRGAINAKQLVYLQGYKRRGKGGGGCVVM